MGNEMINMFLSLMNNGGNPEAIAMQMLSNNPQARQLMEQFKNMSKGMSPKEFAMQLARQRGIDPAQVSQMANKFGIK